MVSIAKLSVESEDFTLVFALGHPQSLMRNEILSSTLYKKTSEQDSIDPHVSHRLPQEREKVENVA